MEFFENAGPLLKTFWLIALGSSFLFVIQTILTFMGADAHDGASADFSGHLSDSHTPFQLFSLRTLTNFLLGFGWAGVCFHNTISSQIALSAFALSIGGFTVLMFFFLMKQMQKLAEDNTFHTQSTLHQSAEVYLSIPPNKTGKGKILISVKGSMRELEAITEIDSKIETGSMVQVVRVENDNLVAVKPL